MKDATVGDNVKQESTRLGQVYWINEVDAVEYFDALNTRIESFTGFSTKTAEKYQIVNYGLGGHYLPHYDSFKKGVRNTIIYQYIHILMPNTIFKISIESYGIGMKYIIYNLLNIEPLKSLSIIV